jgi:hypothetical protein
MVASGGDKNEQIIPCSETGSSSSALADGAQENDVSKWTVKTLKERCRERGLLVSGTKAVLIQRVQDDFRTEQTISIPQINQQTASKQQQEAGAGAGMNNENSRFCNDVDVMAHLVRLVQEYILARDGEASSRDIGRYLSVNPSTGNNPRIQTALQELKQSYGGMSRFLSRRADLFEMLPPYESSSYDYPIRLKH